MPGIEEVAQLAGVSVSTASRAINGRDRVSAATIGANAENEGDFHHPVSRKLGFVEAMHTSGVEDADRFFIPSDFTLEGGYIAAKTALSDPKFGCTAIVAVSDETALGAILSTAASAAVRPADASGFGGHPPCVKCGSAMACPRGPAHRQPGHGGSHVERGTPAAAR